jgi:adenylate cyclase
MADVVGYSQLMEADEAGTLRAVKQHRGDVIDPAIATNKGRLVKLMGDGTLVEFASVVDAVNCAMEIQQKTAERNAEFSPDWRIELRIGINLGDVIVDGEDIYGEGVNVAARLESLAEPGGICLSGSVHDAIGNKLPLRCEFLGEQQVKSLVKPVRSYRVLGDQREPSPPPQRTETRPTSAFRPVSEPTLAVKPFEPLGSDAESDEFADCLSNGILAALTRLPGLTLIQDESPSLQDSKHMSLQELGQRFDVRCLLKGQVRKFGPKIRVNAELLEVSTGRILWADKLDRELQDLGDFLRLSPPWTSSCSAVSSHVSLGRCLITRWPWSAFTTANVCCGRRLTNWSCGKLSGCLKRLLGWNPLLPSAMRKRRWPIGRPPYSD